MHTTGDLLKSLKLDHQVPSNSYLLKLPLALFKSQDHLKIIAFILMLTNFDKTNRKVVKTEASVIKPKEHSEDSAAGSVKLTSTAETKPLVPLTNVAEISKSSVLSYYASIVTSLLNTASKGQQTGFEDIFKWITEEQIRFVFENEPQHKIEHQHLTYLSRVKKYSDYLNVFFQCTLENSSIPIPTLDLNVSPEQITEISELIQQVLEADPKSHRPIYSLIINPKSLMEMLSPYLKSLTTLNFLHKVYMHLYDNTTIGTVLKVMGIEIPGDVDPQVNTLLQLKFKDAEGLTQENWPELIFNILLFVYGFAQMGTPETLRNYTYVNGKSDELLEIAKKHSYLRPVEFAGRDGIQDDLVLKDFYKSNSPQVIAMMCLENCAPLKALFSHLGPPSEGLPIPLFKSPNRFILGTCFALEGVALRISKEDALILQNQNRGNVLSIAGDTSPKSPSPTSSPSTNDDSTIEFDVISDDPISPGTQSSDSIEMAPASPLSIASPKEKSSVLSSTSTDGIMGRSFKPLAEKYRHLEQNFFSMQSVASALPAVFNNIQDKSLRDSLSQGKQLTTIDIVDYSEIQKFLNTYFTTLSRDISPTDKNEEIKHLMQVIAVPEHKEIVIKNFCALKLSLKEIGKKAVIIDDLLTKAKNSTTDGTEENQNWIMWLEFQRKLVTEFERNRLNLPPSKTFFGSSSQAQSPKQFPPKSQPLRFTTQQPSTRDKTTYTPSSRNPSSRNSLFQLTYELLKQQLNNILKKEPLIYPSPSKLKKIVEFLNPEDVNEKAIQDYLLHLDLKLDLKTVDTIINKLKNLLKDGELQETQSPSAVTSLHNDWLLFQLDVYQQYRFYLAPQSASSHKP